MAAKSSRNKIGITQMADDAAYNLMHDRTHAYSHERTTWITLAFVGYGKPTEELKLLQRLVVNRTGVLQHVEIWFPLNRETHGVACSSTRGNGVYLRERKFSDKDYHFYRVRVTQQELDEMICIAYEKQGLPFDTWTARLLMLPSLCFCLRNLCCWTERNAYVCSQLNFTILRDTGVLRRLLDGTGDEDFCERKAATVKTTEIYELLLRHGKMTKCMNHQYGVSRRTNHQRARVTSRITHKGYYGDVDMDRDEGREGGCL